LKSHFYNSLSSFRTKEERGWFFLSINGHLTKKTNSRTQNYNTTQWTHKTYFWIAKLFFTSCQLLNAHWLLQKLAKTNSHQAYTSFSLVCLLPSWKAIFKKIKIYKFAHNIFKFKCLLTQDPKRWHSQIKVKNMWVKI
jgi:hypothetical protein